MKTEWRIFCIVAAFLLAVCGVYAWWTDYTLKEIDWAGTRRSCCRPALRHVAGFFWFVSRRIELRPEDRDDAEIAEGAGEIGFFSPGSYWPFGIALPRSPRSRVSFLQLWLIALGLMLVAMPSPACSSSTTPVLVATPSTDPLCSSWTARRSGGAHRSSDRLRTPRSAGGFFALSPPAAHFRCDPCPLRSLAAAGIAVLVCPAETGPPGRLRPGARSSSTRALPRTRPTVSL